MLKKGILMLSSGCRLKLKSNDSDELIVSREKVQDFKAWLES
jgi:hypothetical protein